MRVTVNTLNIICFRSMNFIFCMACSSLNLAAVNFMLADREDKCDSPALLPSSAQVTFLSHYCYLIQLDEYLVLIALL